jgi:hypothetical protein
MLNGLFHTKKEFPDGRVTMDLSTVEEIVQARKAREVVCTGNCLPVAGCGHCHIYPIDEEFKRLEAILDTGPEDLDQLLSIVWTYRHLDQKLCARYAWWNQRSAEHRQHFAGAEATFSLRVYRSKLRREGTPRAASIVEELDRLIAEGRDKFYEYEQKMGWAQPKRAVQ